MKTALVLECDAGLAGQATDALRRLGYRVLVACNGEDGLEIAHKIQPCAVILGALEGAVSRLDFLTLLRFVNTGDPPRVVLIGDEDRLTAAMATVERHASMLTFSGAFQ